MPIQHRVPESNEVLRAIEALSESEVSLEKATNEQGPGGQAYDRSPSPTQQEEAPEAENPGLWESNRLRLLVAGCLGMALVMGGWLAAKRSLR